MKSVETTSSLGVVVLGMHRSGTSLASRLFGTLGCSYGGELMPAKDDNEEGFWEHVDVVRIHDDFLADRNRTWADPRPLGADDFASPAADRARARIAEVFARDFQSESLWVLKDPRLSRLLPLWGEIWQSAGHRVAYCHTVRNPLAVARSLQKRNGFSQEGALLLWLRHVVEAERFTRGSVRAWIAFEDLIQEPSERLLAACRRMGIDSAFDFEAAAQDISNAVRPDRIHHVVNDGTVADWPWVADARRAILALLEGEDKTSHDALDRLRHEIHEADRHPHYSASVDLMGALQSETVQRARRLEHLQAAAQSHLAKLEADLEDRQAEIVRGKAYGAKLEADHEQARALQRSLEAALAEAGEYALRLQQEIDTKNAYQIGLEARVRQLESGSEEPGD